MLMPKTLYIAFILVVILLSSCSSQKESILVEKKGIINFLEGEIDVLISDSNNGRLEPYVFSIFKDAMPDVEFNFINQSMDRKSDMVAEIKVNDRFTESSPRSSAPKLKSTLYFSNRLQTLFSLSSEGL